MSEQRIHPESLSPEEVAAITAREAKPDDGLVTTSVGAVLRAKRLPDLLVQQIWARFPEPVPPTVEVTGAGGKKWREANPDDPAHRRAQQERTLAIGEAMLKMVLLRGVEIVQLPEGLPPFEEDTEWREDLEYLGAELPTSLAGQKVEWMRYRIVVTNEDLTALQEACNKLAGVTEADVAAAMEIFPGAGG